jgi:riboflavin synthase
VFTGLVQVIGKVVSIQSEADFAVLSVDIGNLANRLQLGDSVSVNGVCLSVVKIANSIVDFEVMGITLRKTNLGQLESMNTVNVELSMTLGDFVGGHLVQGHIDSIGVITEVEELANWRRMRIQSTPDVMKYIVGRGSITVDGVSLTVSDEGDTWFEVSLIPTTLEHTTLGTRRPSDKVNLETDIIARHIEKLVKPTA